MAAKKESVEISDQATEAITDAGEKIANTIGTVFTDERMEFIKDLFFQLKGPLKRILAMFIVFLCVGAFFSIQIVEFFKSLLPEGIMLVAFSPVEVFFSIIWVVIAFAAVFTFPLILVELLRFISPALYDNERKLLTRVFPISLFLFIVGAIFGVSIMAFFGLIFFADFGVTYGIQNLWSLGGLINTMAMVAIGFGIAFQLPIIVTFLVKQKIVELAQFKAVRLHIIVALLIISAVLTPPDIISQILMAVPLYLLFEGTLLYLKVSNKDKEV
ncbi:MAG: twin-arginine translocase subunit TatC [Candidatus Diapherotrites archaeon]|jgi:sec-independent protein translocase protein TatC|uniref:Sec-independent protein translocase protein TatC n=1 Tax=Candidatus Iainarchaeum sp. TaxID=3101447 RepID=A0A8T5GE49_9ARCH|nr:twin-arginine translocase subunit TatC [Candidatus Diapherotrites archaeon]MBT7241112.1 twin-arginine translocase subunit TatC [Candidatus Diapherotrites archaeon]